MKFPDLEKKNLWIEFDTHKQCRHFECISYLWYRKEKNENKFNERGVLCQLKHINWNSKLMPFLWTIFLILYVPKSKRARSGQCKEKLFPKYKYSIPHDAISFSVLRIFLFPFFFLYLNFNLLRRFKFYNDTRTNETSNWSIMELWNFVRNVKKCRSTSHCVLTE